MLLLVDIRVLQRNLCSFALEIQIVGSFRGQDIVCICKILQHWTLEVFILVGCGNMALGDWHPVF
jgi:hypothetical protein